MSASDSADFRRPMRDTMCGSAWCVVLAPADTRECRRLSATFTDRKLLSSAAGFELAGRSVGLAVALNAVVVVVVAVVLIAVL